LEPAINIRDLSIKCGRCGTYQTLVGFEPGDGFHAYVYECEGGPCDPGATRTIIEVPEALDLFYRRHPDCGGKDPGHPPRT